MLSAWFIGWVPHAITHGLNPFFTNAMFVPTGVYWRKIRQALPRATWRSIDGGVQSAGHHQRPHGARHAPLATAAFVVLRKWKVWLPGAALGGFVYGFSAYMVGQGASHLVFTFVPLPPFIALTIVSILQRMGSPWRLGLRLGLLVVAQYLICQEVLVDVAILTFAALVCVALRSRRRIQEMGRAMVRPALVALPVIAALLAYPVWMLTAGPQHATTCAYPVENPYTNDLLSFFVPGPLQRVSFGMGSFGNHLLVGPNPVNFCSPVGSNPIEFDGYIGVVVLALAGFLVWRSRRSPRMQLASVLFLVAAVLSLGPYLVIDARSTHLPLPFLLLAHLPLVGVVLPSRFSLEVFMCLAAVIAFGLDDMHRHRPRPQWLTSRVFAGALVAALVVTQLPQWPYVDEADIVCVAHHHEAGNSIADSAARGHPGRGSGDHHLPLSQGSDPPSDGMADGQRVPLSPPGRLRAREECERRLRDQSDRHEPSRSSGNSLQHRHLMASHSFDCRAAPRRAARPLSPELVSITRTTLSNYDVGPVIVDRSAAGSGPVVKLFNEALGPPKFSTGQFSMWANWHTTHIQR